MPTSVSLSDATRASGRSTSFVLSIVASLTALGAVVGGFALFALALVGVVSTPAGWGGGLCVAGWALASVVRERNDRSAARSNRAA